MVDMVPSRCWTKSRIARTAKSWNSTKQHAKELHITQILPADYKPTDIMEVVKKTNTP
jgi:hypothetical protein